MSSLSFDINGRPRRKHKLKQGTNNTPPPSPLVSPLRYAKQKSLLRISSPGVSKSSPLNMARSMLPGSMPLDSPSQEKNKEKKSSSASSSSLLWDDEEYPEVPKTPIPSKQDSQEESDGISSVSSGSVNGEIRLPLEDESDGEEEWEYKQFHGTTQIPYSKTTTTETNHKRRSSSLSSKTTKKIGKLLGKHKKRFMKKGGKKKNFKAQTSTEVPSQDFSSSSRQQTKFLQKQQQEPRCTSSSQEPLEQQQEQKEQPAEQQQQQAEPSQQQQSLEEPSSQPHSQPQQQQQQVPPKRESILSPIRIRRMRNKAQQPHESPDKKPKITKISIRRGRPDATPTVRADALWTQSIGTKESSDHEDTHENIARSSSSSIGSEDAKQPERTRIDPKEENLPKNESALVEPTFRSDALWAQNMVEDDNGHQEVDSFGILTPELRSPKTPAKTPNPSSHIAPAPLPLFNDTTTTITSFENGLEENDSNDDSEEMEKSMDHNTNTTNSFTDGDTTNTTAAATAPTDNTVPTSYLPQNSIRLDNSDLEDGNIVDEDHLDLIPSDELDDDDDDDDNDHDDGLNEVVPERDNHSSDYYLRQVVSDDEDDEGGVVSDHDAELLFGESNRSRSNSQQPQNQQPQDQEDALLSDILSQDSNSMLVDPSDMEDDSEKYIAPVASQDDDDKGIATEELETEVVRSSQDGAQAKTRREIVEENILNTTQSSNFTLDDSDLAEAEKDKPSFSIGQRSTLTNMQHRLLSMRTIKDTYKRKLVLQEQESVQLQVRLLASQYEAKEAKMSLQNAQAALLHEKAKLQASENERGHQKELLQNLQEQLAIVTAQLQKSDDLQHDGTESSHKSFHSETILATPFDKHKLADMEEQLLVQDEEMDQLAAQIQELKSKSAELEAAKGEAEEKLKEALAREESLKAQLSGQQLQMVDDSSKSNNRERKNSDHTNIQELQELMKASEERFQAESAALRQQLESVQKEHELEIAKLKEQVETNKKLADSAQEEAEMARTKMLQDLAKSKVQHSQGMEELRESLSKAHHEEKSKLHKEYTDELERLEEEIVSSRSELSV